MERTTHLLVLLIFFFFLLCEIGHVCIACKDEERQALLTFKQSLDDPFNHLANWMTGDCCRWSGVGCSNDTGHIIELSIGGEYYWPCFLASKRSLNESLGTLRHLQYLDLSYLCFKNDSIDNQLQFIGSLAYLKYLNLASSNLKGLIPQILGDLSSLKTLYLNHNHLSGTVPESLGKLRELETLDLKYNYLHGFAPGILGHLCNLKTLDLSKNMIIGDLSNMLGQPACKLYNLEELNMSGNQISGSLPDWIGLMTNLRYMFLYENLLNGSLPESLGQLSNLVVLGLTSNSLQGVVSDSHFSNLTKLELLYLSPNNLSFNMSSTWVPPFQLKLINLRSCHRLGPLFPSWLRTQRELSYIDISDAGISDVIPRWFWNTTSAADYLNVSYNQIRGEISASTILSASIIDLRNNEIEGPLPYLNSTVRSLFLYENRFSGDVYPILNNVTIHLTDVLLSRNFLTGVIPSALCNIPMLVLDLSYNHFTGAIPECPSNFTANWFAIINFANNYLHGPIPQWVGAQRLYLQILSLSNNNLDGEIPSLRECQSLTYLDLGENRLTGNIPEWIGELSSLNFLRLRANMFTGTIPLQLSHPGLQFLDLAQNDLTGTIPYSFAKLNAMKSKGMVYQPLWIPADYFLANNSVGYTMRSGGVYLGFAEAYEEMMKAVTKGSEQVFSSILQMVVLLDLSCNRLTGEVPAELMNSAGLQTLNLSGNQLSGKIPDEIGDLVMLETLDLSRNHLTGEIPLSLSSLSFLNHLNLSYNNLSGRIPSGNQLQVLLDPSMYVGNYDLCGTPLPKCPGGDPSLARAVSVVDEKVSLDLFELYLGLGIGYIVGLWGFCVIFLFKNSWRMAYFRFFDSIGNKLIMPK